ncbi:MAG: hypothetical protein NVSMB29_12010 [Candidatus Dormibacteria bacterium]
MATHSTSIVQRGSLVLAGAGIALLSACGGSSSSASSSTPTPTATAAKDPVKVTVFSPGAGDELGAAGVGFIVDVALDANNARGNSLLSASAGYRPLFNAPVTAAGLPDPHTGPDPGAPGLVVLLSSTPTKPGTPFMGPRTNLAGLFQINGVGKVHGLTETWNTWQPQKPLFGLNQPAQLTVYVVAGTAPALVPEQGLEVISNTIKVPFTITG